MSEQPTDETIVELMNRDPLHHTKQNVDDIIKYLRGQRKKFLAGNAKAGTAPAKKSKATKNQEAAAKVTGKIDLGNLF